MTEYYEEEVLRYRVYERPTLKLESGSKYPWSLTWSFNSRKEAEELIEEEEQRTVALYERKIVDAGQKESFRREVW